MPNLSLLVRMLVNFLLSAEGFNEALSQIFLNFVVLGHPDCPQREEVSELDY
jgi:hypothetical protein